MNNINHFNKRAFAFYFSAILISVTLFTSCNKKEKQEEVKTSVSTQKMTYKTEPISLAQPDYTITIPGELVPKEEVSLYAKIGGFVQILKVDIGDYVKKGQILAVLEAPELNQTYMSDKSAEQKVQSDYQYAQQSYARLKEAAETEGAVAALELERAKSAMLSAESAFKASEAQTGHSGQMQRYLEITAPFSGIITEKNVSEGALVGPSSGQPIFRLVQEDNLRLKIALPEKHAASMKDSMTVTFMVNSQPGVNFDATLSRSSRLINRADRSMTLEFDVPNKEQVLNGGEYAQVKLNLQRKAPTFWVTAKSILNTQSGTYILTLNNDVVRKIPIKEGVFLKDKIEVFGDLKEGDQVIARPTEQIKEGKLNV